MRNFLQSMPWTATNVQNDGSVKFVMQKPQMNITISYTLKEVVSYIHVRNVFTRHTVKRGSKNTKRNVLL